MAKYRKRRYYKKGYRRYRRISENYFRARVEAVGKILFPTGQAGNPLIVIRNEVAKYSLTFQEMMEETTFIVMLRGMFSFYRLTGLSIECVPDAANTNGQKQITEPVVMIAPRAGDNTAMNFSEVKAINSALLLNPSQTVRKYTKFYGFTGDWIDTNVFPKGAITCVTSANGLRDTSPSWSFRVNFYLLYKKSRV